MSDPNEAATADERRGFGSNGRLLLPNTTQVPNVIIDRWLAAMSGAKIKIVLYVVRRTYGFGRTSDRISVKQMVDGIVKRDGTRLDYGTGLGRSTVIATVDELVREGVLFKHECRATNGADRAAEVSLNMSYEAPPPGPRRTRKKRPGSEEATGRVAAQNLDPAGPEPGPSPSDTWTPGVQNADPQNRVGQNPCLGNPEGSIDRREREGGPPAKPWQILAGEVDRVPESEIDSEAARIADQIATLVDVRRDRARQLASHCVDRGEGDMLMRAALRVAEREPNHPWPALLTAIANARKEEGGSRKSRDRRRPN